MVVAKKYVLAKRSEGFPKPSDFRLENEELPPLKENEYLVEAQFISVDPYMRAYMPNLPLNATMVGSQVAKIIESKNPNYPVGKYINGYLGWRTHSVVSTAPKNDFLRSYLLPDFGELPLSLGVGMLGMPGNTAYFGFLEICQPKAGETVVVTGAAGAVGSHVGQIAKIKGCKVIGIAGTDAKGKWITEELGFDHFINYKTQNVGEELKKVAPEGVDCFFDNVGGETFPTIVNQMRDFGRVSVCGAISAYNATQEDKITSPLRSIIFKQLKVEGFIVRRWDDRASEAIKQNLEWLKQGKLKYRETITVGFENIFNAFTDMLNGGNTGKAVVKV